MCRNQPEYIKLHVKKKGDFCNICQICSKSSDANISKSLQGSIIGTVIELNIATYDFNKDYVQMTKLLMFNKK